jgi:glycosyltransferase involved in cell wall biosynthesis
LFNLKLIYHNPCSEGGLYEYAQRQGCALANHEEATLFWQFPTASACPEGAEALKAIPLPSDHAKRPKWRRGLDLMNWTLATHRALNRAIGDVQPDAVLMPSWAEYFAPLWAPHLRRWQRRGIRFGAVIHDPVRKPQGLGSWAHKMSLSHAYSFLDVAFVHESVTLDTGRAPAPKTVVIPHGPYSVSEGDSDKASNRKALSIPESAQVLLAFGHIRDGKCLEKVIQALVGCPDCHLIVAGREQSGTQKPACYYKNLAIQLGVSERCHWFISYIPNQEIYRYFRAADRLLLLYSSDFHSMSGVLNINAQFELPVLASAGGGPLLRTVLDYKLGEVLPNTESGTIEQAIKNNDRPAMRWNDYIRDHDWETNAKLVLEALR